MTPKERFLKACKQEEVDRPPVWMMRQAGRYLPEYRAIREKHNTKFMMQSPELACEITLQPIDLIGVDAAIIYSDILMIPDAMGMGLNFVVGEGPKFEFPLNSFKSLNRLNTQNINDRLDYVFKTITLCRQKLGADFPILGFAGAPFTVACYMIHGKGGSDFAEVKKLAFIQPKLFHEIMKLITDATIDYLHKQVDAGVNAIQLFDTWAGLLAPGDYSELAKPYTEKIFSSLKNAGVPSIHYIKGGSYLVECINDLSNNVISVDWRVDMKTIRARTKNAYAIQGNFDPDWLFTSEEFILERLKKMCADVSPANKGYIINLGHGIGEHTPVSRAKFFVEKAKSVI